MDNSKNLGLRNLDFFSPENATKQVKPQKLNTITSSDLKIEYYKEQLTSLNLNLQNEIRQSKSKDTNIQAMQSELIATKNELESLKLAIRNEKNTTAQLNTQLNQLTVTLNSSRSEATQFNQDLLVEKESLLTKIKLLDQSKENAQIQLISRNTELNELKARLSVYRAEEEKLKETVADLKFENQKQKQLIINNEATAATNAKALQDEVTSLKIDLNEKDKALLETNQTLLKLKVDFINVKNESQVLNIEAQKHMQMIDFLKANSSLQVKNIEEKNSQLQSEISKRSEELDSAYLLITNFKSEIHALQDSLERAVQKDLKYNEEMNTLKEINREMASNLSGKETQIINLQTEIQSCKSLIQKLQEDVGQKTKMSKEFLIFLNSERNRIEGAFEHLAKEIQHAMVLHPLKDVLKMTDFELSTCELELKKMPVAAPNRKTTEHKFDKLFQQRKQLRELIAQSDRSLMGYQKKTVNLQKSLEVFDMPVPS